MVFNQFVFFLFGRCRSFVLTGKDRSWDKQSRRQNDRKQQVVWRVIHQSSSPSKASF